MSEVTNYEARQALRLSNIIPSIGEDVLYESQSISQSKSKAKILRDDIGWETHALLGIAKKGLDLDRQWTARTWHRKSSIYERLKLLKDDGFDITKLQTAGMVSEQITNAIIAQVSIRQKESNQPPSQESSERVMPAPKVGQERHGILSHDSQFHYVKYRPLPTTRPKRKRDAEHMTKSPDTVPSYVLEHEEAPEYKRICRRRSGGIHLVPSLAMSTKPSAQTWTGLKQRTIFDISRRAIAAESGFATNSATSRAQIIIDLSNKSPEAQQASDLELSSKGYEVIRKELKTMSTFEEGAHGFRIMLQAMQNTALTTNMDVDMAIHVSESRTEPRQTIIGGRPAALMGLMSRLRQSPLLCMMKQDFDEHGKQTATSPSWKLSDETQLVLRRIEDTLADRVASGGGAVHVRWKYTGPTLSYPQAGVKF